MKPSRLYPLSLAFLVTAFVPAWSQVNLDFHTSATEGGVDANDGRRIQGAGAFSVGDVFVFENVGFDGGNFLDATVEILGLNGVIEAVNGSAAGGSLAIGLSDDGDSNPFVEFRLQFHLGDADYDSVNALGDLGAVTTVSNLTFQSFDIDSQTGQEFTELFGYDTATSSPDSMTFADTTLLGARGWDADGATGYTTYGLTATGTDLDNAINVDSPAFPPNVGDYAINFNYSGGFSSGDFVWGYTGPEASATANRFLLLNGSNPLYIVVPEPGTLLLSSLLLGVGIMARIRRSKSA